MHSRGTLVADQPPDLGRFLTTAEVGRRLHFTQRYVRMLIERGDLEASRFGRQYRVLDKHLERYIRDHHTNHP